jgi:hypothetical protein
MSLDRLDEMYYSITTKHIIAGNKHFVKLGGVEWFDGVVFWPYGSVRRIYCERLNRPD